MTQKVDSKGAENMETENTKFKDGVNRNARLIVRNISFKATEDSLRKHFEPYGTVEEVKLLKRPDGKLVGCGFVHFTHVPMANDAINATNKKPFLGRPVNVGWAVSKYKYDEKLQGDRPKPKVAATPTDEDDTENDVKKEKKEFSKDSKEDKKEKDNKARINRNARLVIRNVSFKATEESLKEHFESYGQLLEVKLLKKPDGKLVGCAFVHYKNVPMAKNALLNTNMKPFLGRPISVDWAVAKNKYMQFMVEQQLDLQDDVKKEDPDSDDEGGGPVNVSHDDLKADVKSESEGSDDDDDSGSDNDDDLKSEQDSDEDGDDDDDEEEDDEEDNDDESVTTQDESKRIKLNDAEDGLTVFLTNIPFEVDGDALKGFAERVGPVKYALICVDKMTEHSKGSGFIKFENKEDADKFLSLPPSGLKLEGQVMQVKPALKRENLQSGPKKQAKDNRNLYLVKEGVVVAGTKAAVGVSASDMAKRLALERSKTQMLKNLNRFVSRYRLVVSNLPPRVTDAVLRSTCATLAGRNAVISWAKVMRDLRGDAGPDGMLPSKGYGFVMFTRHEDALTCLRKLNNNPDIFDKNNRPIVSFSIEDRTALNARKKRLEKSIANNPTANKQNQEENQDKKYNRKRNRPERPDESKMKRGKFDRRNDRQNFNSDRQNVNNDRPNFNNDRSNFNNDRSKFNNGRQNFNNGRQNFNNGRQNFNNGRQNFNNDRQNVNNDKPNFRNNRPNFRGDRQKGGESNIPGKFVKPHNADYSEYTGLTAKEGAQHKMRTNFKLKKQAELHRQTVKMEKKQSNRTMKLKMAAKERIKQPKQKINKNPKKNSSFTEKKVNKVIQEASSFNDLVSKYKSKLVGNSLEKVKAKWYEK